jgi:uncharacterized protein involved in exopolysaccharide biosynthesis
MTGTAEFNLLNAVWVVVRYGRILVLAGLVSLVLATAYAFWLPKVFTATSRIIVPQTSPSSILGSSNELAQLTGRNLTGPEGELYVAIARSRSVADPVVERFDLQQVYQVPYAEDAYNVLNRHLEVNFDNQQSLLTLGITDKDPNRSAALTNALVEELERRSINLTLGSAQRERAFLESHLIEVKHGLVAAEEALKKFQEGNQTFQLDEQTRAIVEAIGNLQGELAGKEIAAGVLRTFQTERNPQLQALKAEISGIRRQIQALENSPVGNEISSRSSVTTGKIPELGLEFGRLLRDFKVKETLYENLSKQYELKRVAEANTTSPLQVLDRATPPQRKSGPKRLFIMVLTTCSTLFLTTVGIFLWDAWQRVTASNQELWDQIKGRILWRRKK